MKTRFNSIWKVLPVLTMAFLLFTMSSCSDDDTEMPIAEDSIAELAAQNENLSTLNALVANNPTLAATLSGNGNLTVFAPTNAAFDAWLTSIGQTSVNNVPEDVVADFLEYHVVPAGAFLSTDLSNQTVTSAQGEVIDINVDNGVRLNGSANVITPDVQATNGVVHVIDNVLTPPSVEPLIGTVAGVAYFNNDFTLLVQALAKADLVNTVADAQVQFTVFAPTNAAFEAAGITSSTIESLSAEELQNILLYHVLSSEVESTALSDGQTVTTLNGDFYISLNESGAYINGDTEITGFDVAASNGIVHVINLTLTPPSDNIVDLAIAGGYNELAAAVTRAGLATTLANEGPFTVFAPTDQAFFDLYAVLGVASVDEIDVTTLQSVLLYHVVSNRVFSTDLNDGLQVDPILEGTTTFTVNLETGPSIIDASSTTTGEASITATNVLATNGVVHEIDAVILPE